MENENISYQIIRSSRKTAAIQITSDGQVLVRCPRFMRSADIRKLVEEKTPWIRKHLAQRAFAEPLPPYSQEEIGLLTIRAKQVIPPRVKYFAQQMGLSYGRITIRCQRSRWGSCSSKGNLNFNCLLMLLPPEIMDYVIVHELCHLKELNHSPRFWAEVESVLPDCKQRRSWLRQQGNAVIGRVRKG